MKSATIARNETKAIQYFKMAATTILFCFALFSLDHETKSVSVLFKTGNLVALLIYFTPAFLLALFIHETMLRRKNPENSFFLSLLIGIPAGFTLVILVLSATMR